MVDIDALVFGSKTIRDMLSNENLDSGIVSDYNSDEDETVSLDGNLDFSKILHEKMR